MDLIREINEIYDSRILIEQNCLDIMIDALGLVDPEKLLLGKNHSFVLNDSILTIALQHKIDTERNILFLFHDDFIELQFDSYIEIYLYAELLNNKEIKDNFQNLILTILDSSFKHIDYYWNNKLIKYTTIWDNDLFPEKTVYMQLFGRIREKLSEKKQYLIKESRAVSFLIDDSL